MGGGFTPVSAPVATGMVTRGGHYSFESVKADGQSGLRVHFRARYGYITWDSEDVQVGVTSISDNSYLPYVALDPSRPSWPNGIRLLTRMFNMYRFNSLNVEYTAQSSTATQGQFTTAYSADFNRALQVANLVPSSRSSALSEMDGAVSFPVYANLQSNVPVDRQIRPTYMHTADSIVYDTTAAKYLGVSGALIVGGGNFAAAGGSFNGQFLWLTGTLDLLGYNPYWTNDSSSVERKEQSSEQPAPASSTPVMVAAAGAPVPNQQSQPGGSWYMPALKRAG